MGRTRQPREIRETTESDLLNAAHASTDIDNDQNPLSEPSDEIDVWNVEPSSPGGKKIRRNAVVNMPELVVKKLKFIAFDRDMSIGAVLLELAGDRIDAAYNEVFEKNAP